MELLYFIVKSIFRENSRTVTGGFRYFP